MADNTAISWADATQNFWIGCTKVGPGCDHCYAERDFDLRKGVAKWGNGNPRHRTGEANWRKPIIWNKNPEKLIGQQWPARKPRVFAQSLSDMFDNEIDPAWRDQAFAIIRATTNLQWLIVTKRIGNARKMLPHDFSPVTFPNVVLISTVVNQEEADRDVAKLLAIPAAARGLSIEPMLGPIDLTNLSPFDERTHGWSAIWKGNSLRPCLDWVICGGESGPRARPAHPDWFRDLRDQCVAAGVPFFFKQWGEFHPDGQLWADGTAGLSLEEGEQPVLTRVGKKRAGRKLDGVEHNGFPPVFAEAR